MGTTVFKNGSLARERVRDTYGFDWAAFSAALASHAARQPRRDDAAVVRSRDHAARGRRPAFVASDLDPADAPANVRAIVEAR